LKEFIYDFKYPEILLILSKQKGDSWPLLGAFPIPPVLLVVADWKNEFPSAVKCLEKSLESCLTYLQFPEEEWICLRTTNVIERVNKEFKRRTKPMEILAGERSCYTLLAFVCVKMEVNWRKKPIGEVPKNLPFLKKLAEKNFTQSN
jgi:putative transposase